MSINVNKITSTLAKLGDAELQQYAQMHKNDPYIMALAMSESNRRKEIRDADQGAQGMQEQPKVVDQMVAEMAPQQLPEDMGIARIPAGEMNFAGGGIVAFADGGDVERYSGEFGSLVEPIDPLTGTFYMPGHFDSPADPASMRRVQASPYVPAQMSAEEAALLRRRPAPTTAPRAETKPDTTRKETGERKTPVAAPTAKADTGGLDSLIKDFTRQTDLAVGESRNARVGLASALEQIPKERAARNEEERKKEGDVFAAREARLAEREKGVAGMKDKNFGLALLQAGAAMMSTPGNLGTAIGKGVQVGSERYIAGIDKINAAKDRFAEARDRLDDLRLNRADMTKKEIRDEQRDIDNGVLQAKKLLADGLDNDLKVSNDRQKALLGIAAESILTDKRIQGQLQAARISASQPNAQMQIATALGGGDLEAGLRKMAEIQAGKFNLSNSYADYLKAFAGKETLTPPLSFSNYAAQFGATLPR